jgi:membrane-associated phospholipid phosphatase
MARRPFFLLALAFAGALAAVFVWLVAFSLPTGRSLDARALQAFAGVVPAPLTPSIKGAAALADPLPLALGGLALAALAIARHRLLMAATVVLILVGANVTTQLLKPALADLRIIEVNGLLSIYPGSWPSGHSTAAMSLALCLVLVVGPQLRPLAALLGAGYAIAVGYALVALGYHLPSDVFGGYLVAATFALLGIAGLAKLEARLAPRTARQAAGISPRALAGAAAAVFVAGGLIVVVQAPGITSAALRSPAAVAAAAGIGMFGLALTAGLAFALRR